MSGAGRGAGSTYAKPTAKRGTGAAMAGGNPGHLAHEDREREHNDFYPTPKAVTEALAKTYDYALIGRMVWEPAAGDGAMVDVLRAAGATVFATDIEPRRADVAKLDIFDDRLETSPRIRNSVQAVVTNPPFNLAEKMIRRILAPGFLPNLTLAAFVLKGTFWHAKTRLPLFEEHMPYAVHPLTWRPDFHGLGRPTMDCMWCVWTPGSRVDVTMYAPMREPKEPAP